MSYSKVLPIGSVGQLELSESAGVVTLKASITQAAGGGSMEGVAKVSANVELDLSAKQLIDAALELAAQKFPLAAPAIEGAKAMIDAELAKA